MTEWKPGDVATSAYGRVFAVETGNGVRWVYDDGSGGVDAADRSYDEPHGARPLVVIDPEDREQVERLALLLRLNFGNANGVQRALSEYAANPKPPKPEEPRGLGAVVEDREGQKWLRVAWVNPWCLANPGKRKNGEAAHGSHKTWKDVDAVRVLSEGVRDD